ncbi:hypothetical protein SAMN06295967_10757 [Belliella buryatensis]|uniref:Uncharacterized protein n=1 Tax=Belliella buryatensis TaxID=1500549 RepID=A0A239DH83_9BACT|nr:hypothetical protein SAMN06295967_10757 [Belliella buryatensis]
MKEGKKIHLLKKSILEGIESGIVADFDPQKHPDQLKPKG